MPVRRKGPLDFSSMTWEELNRIPNRVINQLTRSQLKQLWKRQDELRDSAPEALERKKKLKEYEEQKLALDKELEESERRMDELWGLPPKGPTKEGRYIRSPRLAKGVSGMRVIKITQTTRTEEIIAAIADALLQGEPFVLGRYQLTLRGHLWMVDDTVSGIKNIDGISQGDGLASDTEAYYVAKVIYKAWVADEWAQPSLEPRGASTRRRSRRRNAASYNLEQTITQKLKKKYPPPVKKTMGTAIWEDAKYLALDALGDFDALELIESADIAMHTVTGRGTNWGSVMDQLKHYDEDYFQEGLHGVLVGFTADAIADAVERNLISTPAEAAEYDYYS